MCYGPFPCLSLDKAQNEGARSLLDHALTIEPTYPLRCHCWRGAMRNGQSTIGPRTGIPEAIWGLRQLATALAQAGRKDDARRECKKLRPREAASNAPSREI